MPSRNPTEAYRGTSGKTLGNDRNDETHRQIVTATTDSLNNQRARASSSTNSHTTRDLITTEASDQEGRRQRRRLNTGPCCSCARSSTCYRSTFGHGSQGCECRSASRKCLPSCQCSKKCTNQHQAPTPGSNNGGAFEPYAQTPAPLPLIISAAGPGGTDSVALRSWLLGFGQMLSYLCSELAAFATWLASANPLWASYRALMACRLVALDKQPGVRPVGIGEIYRCLFAKCILSVVGDCATQACGNFNLCAGLKAGIEGAVPAICQEAEAAEATRGAPATQDDPELAKAMLDKPADASATNPHGTLCVDARNGFNEYYYHCQKKALLNK